jgi:hypothetical protein
MWAGEGGSLHRPSFIWREKVRAEPGFVDRRQKARFLPAALLRGAFGIGDFPAVRAESIEIELFDRRCRVISLDALIRAKEALVGRRTCSRSRS